MSLKAFRSFSSSNSVNIEFDCVSLTNDDQKLDNNCVGVGHSPFNASEENNNADEAESAVAASLTMLSLKSDYSFDPIMSYQKNESDSENGNSGTTATSKFADAFEAYKRGKEDLITSLEPQPKTVSVIQWGKFKGMVDERAVRCPHAMANMKCHCTHLPIVPSKLRHSTRSQDVSRHQRQISKRRSFSNLSFQFAFSDENSPSSQNENESVYINYTNSFRKKLHYYKELNGLKLRRHISGAIAESSDN